MAKENENNPLLGLSECLAAAVERVSAAVVAIDARPRVPTSGIVWRDGVIVSTSHTIRRDEEIVVGFADGPRLPAKLVGRDPSTDLAVLGLESDDPVNIESITTVNQSELKIGNLALALGRVHFERGVTAGLGIISVLGDKWRTWRGGAIDHLIRPDISIFMGFSGGPLIDVQGRIIGINTTGLARGAGLTIPVSTVNRVVDTLLEHGRIPRPYLGVTMQPVALPDELRSKFGLTQDTAVVILSVETESPAARAGTALGDVLLTLGDTPLTDTNDVQAALSGSHIGQIIHATVLRGGERREMTLTLGERPQGEADDEHETKRRWRRSRYR
jgi:S1-C subfamily serine protease